MLSRDDIEPGRTYRAKKPKGNDLLGYNDRTVLHVNSDKTEVQYDGITVRAGRNYPTVTMDAFLKWAGRRVAEDDGA